MNEQTDRSRSVAEHGEHGERPLAGPVAWVARSISTPFGTRHAKGVAAVRWLVAVWLVCLGSAFCVFGRWWGALLFPVAGGVAVLAYVMPRWRVALDADGRSWEGARSPG
jgi:hypothetical protein